MTEKKKLYPRELYPPPEVIRKMREREKNKMPKNKTLRFLKVFFGEGF